jgi:osmotically-inducible protein OsmY
MKVVFRAAVRTVLIGGLLVGGLAFALPQDQSNPKADNTKVNERDRDPNQPTADQQKENSSDRELSQQIRKAIASDKNLSTYAHNIKIIAQNGMVTLKGPVRSEDEKKAIETKAAQIAGDQKITSQLEVKPKD